MSDKGSFARQLLATPSASAWADLEARVGKSDWFQTQDGLLDTLLRQALGGQPLLKIMAVGGDRRRPALGLPFLSPEQQQVVNRNYDLRGQQAQGAWFLPEEASINATAVNLRAHFKTRPRFAHSLAEGERGKFGLRDNPDAVYAWAVLAPLFSALYGPLEWRGPKAVSLDKTKHLESWAEYEALAAALGLDLGEALAILRYGGGWNRLRAEEQVAAKERFFVALEAAVGPGFAARYRAHCLRPLVERHQAKSKKTPAKRTQVLTKELERTLAAFFNGSWLAFLDYVESPPHPDEAVVTALPEPRLIAETSLKAQRLAREKGLPLEEVERMLQSLWGEAAVTSPVEQRVAVLKRFWSEFDAIHARQAPGMPPLWGLVQEFVGDLSGQSRDDLYQSDLHHTALSPTLSADIARLWGGTFLKERPEVIVDSDLPHRQMAQTLGPALRFWQGTALTAWFLSEGPSSRTDMGGLREYHRRDLEALEALGCSVDPALFARLIEDEKLLGRPEAAKPDRVIGSPESIGGIELTITLSSGWGRRKGFERLRDTITRHRRAWAERHLEGYLRARWQTELRSLAREYARLMAAKGKAPSVKTFARLARDTTEGWFGGSLTSVYITIGEPSPFETLDRRGLLPADRSRYLRSVFDELCMAFDVPPKPQAGVTGYVPYEPVRGSLARVAEFALEISQLEALLGRPPTLEEFGPKRFKYPGDLEQFSSELGWNTLIGAVQRAREPRRLQREETVTTPSPSQPHLPNTAPTNDKTKDKEGFFSRLLKGFRQG